ncbi:hypothetical protein DFJ74DRAFT_600476 [Hyaloraphidium curvatum]|nr:hypothetical protein DFJ74DRAFT_600476 [Hyaloraphidium curvatum]
MQPNPIRAKGSKPPCVNEDIVQELEAIRKHLDAAPKKEADNFRVIQYRKAIQSIRRYPKRITSVEEAKKVYQVGERIAEKIGEFLRTGRTQRLAHLENDPEQRTLELFRSVHGCGSAQASQWYNQGMRTLDDLRARTDLTRQQRIGLELYDELNTRIPRAEVEAMIALVNQVAAGVDVLLEVHDQGSYRRGAPDSGDVDLLITHPNEAKRMESSHALVRQLVAEGIVTHELAWGEGNVFMGVAKLPVPGSIHRRIDLLCIPFSEIGAALLHFTGNDIFNRSLRLLAKKKGYTLSQHGLHVANRFTKDPELKRGKLVASETEEAIFAALGVPWRPPHERNVGVEFEGWVNGGASSAGPSSDVLPASDAEPGWGAPDLRADDEVHSD